jgi:hypothetical protein
MTTTVRIPATIAGDSATPRWWRQGTRRRSGGHIRLEAGRNHLAACQYVDNIELMRGQRALRLETDSCELPKSTTQSVRIRLERQ